METKDPRIISLIASSTEIVCALGFEKKLVGRSHECDYPLSVKNLPSCSEPKFNIEGNSKEIDDRVKEIVKDSLSVYRVFENKLKELQPTHIVTQDHCEVCAVSLKDVENAVCDILESKPKIVTLHPNALEDIWKGIGRVADSLSAPERGKELVCEFKERMQSIASKCPSSQKTVACIEWLEPMMFAGNWVPELVQMTGVKDLFGTPGKHSPWMKFEELVLKDPDIILVMPCGWDIQKSYEELHFLCDRPEWSHLKAVKNNQVYLTDGNQYFNRPGPRVVESLEIMAEIFFPDQFNFGHEGIGWKNLRDI